MGPTNEVLRQFVGKTALLGMSSLDYWNQVVNVRAIDNEIKKLTRRARSASSRAPAGRGEQEHERRRLTHMRRGPARGPAHRRGSR